MVCEKSFFFCGISKHTIPKLYASATDIACDGGGVGDQGGCNLMLFSRTSQHPWLLDYCNMQSLGAIKTIQALPLLLMRAGLKHPSSSSFAFVKLLLLCFCEAPLSALVNTRVGFLGPYWCPKLGLLGQIGFETAFIGSNWCVNRCSNCFCSANLVSRFVYWVKLVSKV
jgi:hypothetical protein